MNTRVLIVEDNLVVANNLYDRLQDLGYQALGIARSGEQAVRLAAETKPDLVLMDIRLQGEKDGIQAADEIRRQRDVPVIYLTGYADQSILERAKLTDPYGYLLKPFDGRELDTTIEMALHRHAVERQLRESEEKYRALVEESVVDVAKRESAGEALERPSGELDRRLSEQDVTATPLRNGDGEIASYVAATRDVDLEVSREEQLYNAQKMESLGRLAGGIAHDFNNLLTIIELGARQIECRLQPDDPMWVDLRLIRDTTKRATDLTRQLLRFSRRELHQLKVLNVSQLAQDLSSTLQRIIGSDIQLATVLAEDLWLVEADPTQMEQVIMNLVVNARDAMPEGGTLTIETANIVLDETYAATHLDTQPGPHVKLTVTDSGVGMPSEVKAHVFEPFFSTKKGGEGTGLGLATVFGIVKQAGGHIELLSEVGAGTSIGIYLPKTDKGASQPEESPSAAVFNEEQASESILVVEDDPVLRDLTVRVLASRGYHVQAAADGQEALDISEQDGNDIDLLLIDLVLPKMGGWELSERLQKQRPDTHVLYMSGYGDDTSPVRRVLDAGRSLLAKPFDPEELASKVRAVLDSGGKR